MDIKQIQKIFFSSLSLKKNVNSTKLKYGDQNWDSIAHMALIANLDDEFEIIDTFDSNLPCGILNGSHWSWK